MKAFGNSGQLRGVEALVRGSRNAPTTVTEVTAKKNSSLLTTTQRDNTLRALPNPETPLEIQPLNIDGLEPDDPAYPDGNSANHPVLEQDPETSPGGFGEVNNRTQGKEFYGPAATLAFLLELRRCARAYQQQTKPHSSEVMLSTNDTTVNHASSIVNFCMEMVKC